MENQDPGKANPRVRILGAGMALGLVLGGLLGLVADKLVLFSGGGMIVGLAFATAFQSRQTRI